MRFFLGGAVVRTATATVENDCSGVASWSDGGSAWWKPDLGISSVHIVTMTHLDVGFTNSTRGVCDTYFDRHFPAAAETANELRRRKSAAAFKWTTFPWLLQEFLDGAAGCATRKRRPQEIAAVRQAIEQDDIIWHANALNSFLELYDSDLLAYSISLKDALNSEFGKQHGVVCGKQTDVPGVSIAAVPVLARAGVKAMHLGYNGACKLPEALPPIFRWRHEATGAELVVMVEAGYGLLVRVGPVALAFFFVGDNGPPPSADEVENYWAELQQRFPLATLRASSLDDFTSHVLASPSLRSQLPVVLQDIGDSWLYGAAADPIKLAVFRQARRHTQASIRGKRLSGGNPYLLAYMRRLLKSAPEHNWGLSVAAYFPALRSQTGNWSNPLFAHARATLPAYALLEAEWAAQRAYNYPLPYQHHLSPARTTDGQGGAAASDLLEWLRFRRGLLKQLQRVEAGRLPHAFSSVRLDAEQTRRTEGARARPRAGGTAARTDTSTDILEHIKAGGSRGVFVCGNVEIGFNASDGAVERLVVLSSLGREGRGAGESEEESEEESDQEREEEGAGIGAAHNWAAQIGSVRYQTFTEANFEAFNADYTPGCVPCDDFSKRGMHAAQPEAALWVPSLSAASLSTTSSPRGSGHEQCLFTLQVAFAEEACAKYGAPRAVSLHYLVPGRQGAALDIGLAWQNKSATRLAEALWTSLALRVPNLEVPPAGQVARGGGNSGGRAHGSGARAYAWQMHVLDSWLSPYSFVVNGSRHMHAVQRGVRLVSLPSDRGRGGAEGAGARGGGRASAQGQVIGKTQRLEQTLLAEIESLDAPLVSLTDIDHLLRYDGQTQPPRPRAGHSTAAHFNLYNNVWGTAFPQWQSGDASFRFRVFLAPRSRLASFPSSRASAAQVETEAESDEEAPPPPEDGRGLQWLKTYLQFFSSLIQ
eukprot:Tamp_02337.p1 GENE.Tamp_02337~~Tamp_02337.p1  ORF type:complete len:933 (-),score=169.09 Tamp_02337:1642-4440(-)